MTMTGDYIQEALRHKGIQRDAVVRMLFGSQTAVARLLGVTQSTVNHVIFFRRRSSRVERFMAAQVARMRPDLADLWRLPRAATMPGKAAKNGKKAA